MIRSRLKVLFGTTTRLWICGVKAPQWHHHTATWEMKGSGWSTHVPFESNKMCDHLLEYLSTHLLGKPVCVQMRGHRKEQQALISAAKASDLLLQRDRMLRAFRGAEEEAPQEEDEEGEPAALASDPQWQDPSEWDPATRRQWEDFMRKSKAMRVTPPPPFCSSQQVGRLSGGMGNRACNCQPLCRQVPS